MNQQRIQQDSGTLSEKDQLREEKERKREERDRQIEEEERRIEEEKAQKEQKEFESWKALMQVEETGLESAADKSLQEAEN